MLEKNNSIVYRRLGVTSKNENTNYSSRLSKYNETLGNKSYSIFLENVTLKNTINDCMVRSSSFVTSAEDGNNTKKNFFRKIVDRILEIWDKFLDWLYRVQIKIVTSRLFKKINSILERLRKKFNVYPINIEIKKYIKNEFIDSSYLNEGLEEYTKKFENASIYVQKRLKFLKDISDELREGLNSLEESNIRKIYNKFDHDSLDDYSKMNGLLQWCSVNRYSKRITGGGIYGTTQSYVTIKIKNKEEDKKIRSLLTKKVEQIKRNLETSEAKFKDLFEVGKSTKNSVEKLIDDNSQKNITNETIINLINRISEKLNLYMTDQINRTNRFVQDSNKEFYRALSILEADLSEFLK